MVTKEFGLVGRAIRNADVTQDHALNFEFKLDKRPKTGKGLIFVPLSREQLRAVALFEGSVPRYPSDIELSVFPQMKVISWFNFFPLGRSGNRPTGIGIGTLVHHAITEFLVHEKPYRSFKVLHATVITTSRQDQLHSMGVVPGRLYPLEEYAAKIRGYASRKFGHIPKVQL